MSAPSLGGWLTLSDVVSPISLHLPPCPQSRESVPHFTVTSIVHTYIPRLSMCSMNDFTVTSIGHTYIPRLSMCSMNDLKETV